MRDHHEQGAGHAGDIEGGDAEQDEAHMADRGERDDGLEIGLAEGEERAVQDVHERDDEQCGQEPAQAQRQRVGDPQQPVGPHLEQHAGEHDAHGGRRLDVGQRKPTVEGEGGDLHREADEEREERPDLEGPGPAHAGLLERGHVERAGLSGQVDRKDAQQHEDRAGEGVEEERHRGTLLARAAPHADEEEHRDQCDLPEHVEQEPVARYEHAEDRELQHEHPRVVALGFRGDALGGDQRHDRQQRREQNQGETEAIDAEAVGHLELGDPHHLLGELLLC